MAPTEELPQRESKPQERTAERGTFDVAPFEAELMEPPPPQFWSNDLTTLLRIHDWMTEEGWGKNGDS